MSHQQPHQRVDIALAERSYPILIGPHLLEDDALLGEFIAARNLLDQSCLRQPDLAHRPGGLGEIEPTGKAVERPDRMDEEAVTADIHLQQLETPVDLESPREIRRFHGLSKFASQLMQGFAMGPAGGQCDIPDDDTFHLPAQRQPGSVLRDVDLADERSNPGCYPDQSLAGEALESLAYGGPTYTNRLTERDFREQRPRRDLADDDPALDGLVGGHRQRGLPTRTVIAGVVAQAGRLGRARHVQRSLQG